MHMPIFLLKKVDAERTRIWTVTLAPQNKLYNLFLRFLSFNLLPLCFSLRVFALETTKADPPWPRRIDALHPALRKKTGRGSYQMLS